MAAMTTLSIKYLLGAKLEISLAKPPSDKKRKEEMLKREQGMMQVMTESVAWPPSGPVHGGAMMGGEQGQSGWGGGEGQWHGQGGIADHGRGDLEGKEVVRDNNR